MADRGQDHHWQALLESAAEGIWGVDREGNCTFVNRMASQIFGFESHELVGRNMHALVHHHRDNGDEYPASECPVYEIFISNVPVRQQNDTMFRKDGSSFLAEISAEPVLISGEVVGVIVTFRDVTEQDRQHKELRRARKLAEQSTAELNAVIESIPHAVFIGTPDGKVRLNRRAREMTGETFPPQLRTLDRALSGESSTETICLSKAWIRSVAAPIVSDGSILGGVAVNTDITAERLQEDALRKAEKLAAVGQLASSIAHEINNPLESVTNLLYLVQHSGDMDEVKTYASMAQTELARVTEITLQTLRFHRQQSKPSYISLSEVLESTLSLYTGRFLVRGITVDRRILPSEQIFCMEGEVRQVLNNLVRNAADAMAVGGTLYVRLRQAHHFDGRAGLRVTIADTGEGISPQIVEHLFEPFHTTKEVTGTGLGLWVSKGIVDKHGGTISARTRRAVPSGTVFAIWLPLYCGDHAAGDTQ